jgi:hypothetical protein
VNERKKGADTQPLMAVMARLESSEFIIDMILCGFKEKQLND